MSGLELVPRLAIPAARWNVAAAAMDSAWLWHTWEFQDTLCTWPGRRDHSRAACDSEGHIHGLLPLHVTEERLGPLRMFRVDSFGGPAVAAQLLGRQDALRSRIAQALWTHAEDLAERLGAVEVTASLAPVTPAWSGASAPAVNPLLFLGLESVAAQAWLIDLTIGPDALWKGMQGRARTAIRKAGNSGLIVREAGGVEDAAIYAHLHAETFRRTGATPHPESYSRSLFTVHQPCGEALILFAQDKAGTAAAAIFAVHKSRAYYWTAAASEEARRAGAPSLLLWHGMRLLHERGVCWLDVGNAFPQAREGKLKGLSDFKASFGGTLVPHWRGRLDRASRSHRALRGAWQVVKAMFP
ncbi:MAG: GNAT family N-acetyltransferase [Rhodospirillaceae bacterium]